MFKPEKHQYAPARLDIRFPEKGGLDSEGYDVFGYNIYRYDHAGYDINGFDELGYDINGFSHTGFDRSGYDKNGLNIFGYDWHGYNAQGEFIHEKLTRENFTEASEKAYESVYKSGYDREKYNYHGINGYGEVWQKGLDSYKLHCEKKEIFNITALDSYGFDTDSFLSVTFNVNDLDIHGFYKYDL